ncbi:uncharacterized protein (TIGR02284 family) [Kordia periserrulae]|uniref:Uncharacterized protein (TIGR02284 family) n=1 Tax=Kordia periserrulae TaxID=701523 RepID=A0A2T6BRX4_9FLAO|nr:PA2169 family four-helix-bundle protein [Kordia periserrulae]PTX58812.1 uncharacterized protein (TIGR02284 family) [Kordia periserrulae]
MYDYNEELGKKLNNLLEKTYDAEKGYKKAAENAKSDDMTRLFERRAKERYDFGHAIKSELSKINQKPDKGGSVTGTAHRTWMDVKSWFTSDTDEAMLEAAITGEKAAVSEYDEILSKENEPYIPKDMRIVLESQRNIIKHELENTKILEEIA